MAELRVANYVFYNIPLKFQIALFRLRCSAHDLNIEIGGHDNIPQENRICYLCNSQTIENEFHFIMTCLIYDEIRHIYLPHLDNVVKDITAFCRLMNSEEIITKRLAKYLYYAFKLRWKKFVEFEFVYARNIVLN